MGKKRVIIIGAGPAGLTSALVLLNKSNKYDVIVLEASSDNGGISKTINYKGNRMDLGGHRFFTKDDEWKKWCLIRVFHVNKICRFGFIFLFYK